MGEPARLADDPHALRRRPPAGNEATMPVQRLRPHEESAPTPARQHSAEPRKKQAVGWPEPRLTDLPAKNGQFLPEQEDLQLLRPLASAEEQRPARAEGSRRGRRSSQAKATSNRQNRRR
jgi:hypothetical protein